MLWPKTSEHIFLYIRFSLTTTKKTNLDSFGKTPPNFIEIIFLQSKCYQRYFVVLCDEDILEDYNLGSNEYTHLIIHNCHNSELTKE